MDHPRALGADSLVLCSGTIGSASLIEKAEAAAAAGFGGISFYVREWEAARAAGWTDDALRTHLAGLGLAVAEADGMFAWLGRDDDPPRSVDELFAAGEAIGARSATLLVPPGPPIDDSSIPAMARGLHRTAERAATFGILVHLEPFAWSGLRDFAVAAELCRRADHPNAGVLVDAWHLAAGPDLGLLPESLSGAQVVGIQLCESRDPQPPDVAWAGMHDRLLPGPTSAALLRELRDRGCTAPVGVEVYSDEVHALDPATAAATAFAALCRVVDESERDQPSR